MSNVSEPKGEISSNPNADDTSNTQKHPSQWKSGGEPMTGAQRSYLETLSEEAGVKPAEDLTKAEASQKIDELRQNNPRTSSAAS